VVDGAVLVGRRHGRLALRERHGVELGEGGVVGRAVGLEERDVLLDGLHERHALPEEVVVDVDGGDGNGGDAVDVVEAGDLVWEVLGAGWKREELEDRGGLTERVPLLWGRVGGNG
jgi:hypothetical protein